MGSFPYLKEVVVSSSLLASEANHAANQFEPSASKLRPLWKVVASLELLTRHYCRHTTSLSSSICTTIVLPLFKPN
jgi:hypothetical protein